MSCYEVYSCPHATIPTSLPSTISWCKSSPLYSSRTTPQFFVKSNHSQKPQASLRNTRAITHTHFRCRVQRKLFVGTTATKEHATHHYSGHNANSSQTSDPKNRGNLRELRYLTCIYISSRLISRSYEVAILRFSVAFQCKYLELRERRLWNAAKLQLLVVANCNLLDYIQSLHAQSSWIDAKSGIATDFDTNSLVPNRKTRPAAACWMLLVHAYKRISLTVCNGIREYVHESRSLDLKGVYGLKPSMNVVCALTTSLLS